MNNLSGITIGLSLIGLVLLVVALVAIFYRPAKRLNVSCNFKSESDEKNDAMLKVEIENVGKRNLKLMSPYVRFSHATHTKLYQVKPETIDCKFPRMLKIGQKLSCEVDLGHFKTILQKQSFSPTHAKVIISDSAGLDFESQSLTFKV
jgi:hypothetical protein